jgi:hypothetical protein
MSTTQSWNCPGCHREVATAYCPECGERRLQPYDLTLLSLLAHVFHSVSNVDGKLLRSFRSLVTRPGQLTAAYLDGPREPYIAPFQFFLIVNVLFFGMQSVAGLPIFSTPLQSHLYKQDWSPIAQTLVAQRLATLNTTLEAYTPLFDQGVDVNAKSLVVLMVLPFAVVLWAMFRRSGRPLVTHVIFSLHFYAALLLLCCLLLALIYVDAGFGGTWTHSASADHLLFAVVLLSSAVYIYIAAGVVYSSHGLKRATKAILLAIAVGCGVLGYRFLIFLITLYST